jgi:hypothetical protein
MEVSGQLHAPAAFLSGKELPVPLDGRLLNPRAGLVAVRKRKISCPCRETNPDSSAMHPEACEAVPLRRRGKWSYSPTIFDHMTRWRWVVSFTPLCLNCQRNNLWYPLHRGRLDIRTGLGAVQKRKVSCRESNLDSSQVQSVARRYMDYGLDGDKYMCINSLTTSNSGRKFRPNISCPCIPGKMSYVYNMLWHIPIF